ncbi:MAG: DUF6655 family protein [Planctomycetaceae bacterium]
MAGWVAVLLAGCGTTQQKSATEQLLESDAVDAAIADIDFSPLSGESVFFDDTYLKDYKGVGFVNSAYIISSLRQQILAAGCKLEESKDKAEIIIEGRIGALGSDRHDVVYGIPQNNAVSAVASAVPAGPALPQIPELSVAKKASALGAAKIAVFAYDRESRERVWQSGLSVARSTSKDTWVLGAGPFQDGTIHRNNVRFAGTRLKLRFWMKTEDPRQSGRFTAYEQRAIFNGPAHLTPDPATMIAETDNRSETEAASDQPAGEIQQVAHEEPAAPKTTPPANAPSPTAPVPQTTETEPAAAATPPETPSASESAPPNAAPSAAAVAEQNDAGGGESATAPPLAPAPFPASEEASAQPIGPPIPADQPPTAPK